jgi:hypothetical protein
MDLLIAFYTAEPQATEDAFVQAWSNALSAEHRIATRLGLNHEISQIYHFAVASLGRASKVVGDAAQSGTIPDQAAFKEQVKYFNQARYKFAEAAVGLIGSRLPDASARTVHTPVHTRSQENRE